MIYIKNTEISYLIGLLQTDGSNYKEPNSNKGRIKLELSTRDCDIIFKLNNFLQFKTTITNRTRNTNFKQNYTSISLNIYNKDIRNFLSDYIPIGHKSELIKQPDNVVVFDYWRGIIDGDGSLGITKNNIPFISLTTQSELLARDFIIFIEKLTGTKKKMNRNKRDNIYNITVTKEKAQLITKSIYYDNCLALDRKLEKSILVLNWIRSINMVKCK